MLKRELVICLSVFAIYLSGAYGSDVRDFGAIGDGVQNDTVAVQRAIDAGGVVHFPRGTYLCGTLYLRSNGGLDLSPDARILGSANPGDYNKPDFCPQNYGAEVPSKAHLICAVGQTNIVIRGGTIDGNSEAIFSEFAGEYRTDMMGGRKLKKNPTWQTSQMLFICECENVRLADVNLVNSCFWNCMLYGCEHVHVRGLRIKSDPMKSGDDGLDIDCCRHVTVSDCQIDTGDDGLTLRASGSKLSRERPCEWITVNNCIIRSAYAHAIRVGVGTGVIRHCSISNVLMEDTRGGIHVNALYGDSSRKRPGVEMSDISFSNVHGTADILLFVALDYKFARKCRFEGTVRDLRFSNITGTTRLPIKFIGNGIGHLKDITFKDSTIEFKSTEGMPEGDYRFFMCDPVNVGERVQTNNTENVVFKNVVFR